MLVLIKSYFWEEDWTLGYTYMEFWVYNELSLNRSVTCEVTLLYQFITNNHASGKFGKTSKFSKYDHSSLQNFVLYFMSLQTVPTVKTVIFWLEFTSYF